MSAHHVDADELAALTELANRAAESMEHGPVRDKLVDFEIVPHVTAIYQGETEPMNVADGEAIEFDPFSFVGGVKHPASMGMRFHMDRGEAVGRATISPSYAGPPERVHGGAVASMVDETMGILNRVSSRRAFTASLTVDYRNPAPLGTEIEFRARDVSDDGRKVHIACIGTGPDGVFAEAKGLFIRPRET